MLGLCKTEPIMELSSCVNHVWRDQRNRWKRGCERVGSKNDPNPIYQCAIKTDIEGHSTLRATCLGSNPDICRMPKATLRRNETFDFIYDL